MRQCDKHRASVHRPELPQNPHSTFFCDSLGLFVARVGVANYACGGVGGKDALEANCCLLGAVGDGYLADMDGVADADAPAMVN